METRKISQINQGTVLHHEIEVIEAAKPERFMQWLADHADSIIKEISEDGADTCVWCHKPFHTIGAFVAPLELQRQWQPKEGHLHVFFYLTCVECMDTQANQICQGLIDTMNKNQMH